MGSIVLISSAADWSARSSDPDRLSWPLPCRRSDEGVREPSGTAKHLVNSVHPYGVTCRMINEFSSRANHC